MGGGNQVDRSAARSLSIAVWAMLATASACLAQDDFPLVGTYTENEPCKPEGSDPNASKVKITPTEIDSVFGLCTVLQKKREGNTFTVQVDCKGAGGTQMLGDINFTIRDDKTVDFSDHDQTYKAVLHKCP
jgi:hypothetical protein